MSNIFVSNNEILSQFDGYKTYNDFVAEVTSSEGLDTPDDLQYIYIDVNDMDETYYNAFKEALGDYMQLFTLQDEVPDYAENLQYVDLRESIEEAQEEVNSQESQEPQESQIDDTQSESLEQVEDKEFVQENKYEYFDINKEETSINNSSVDDIQNLLTDSAAQREGKEEEINNKEGEVYATGSSKGGGGKTSTCVLGARRYAKQNPHKKVAIADFDLLDGQLGITIHKIGPTLYDYYSKSWNKGDRDFSYMENYHVNADNFPSNLDFYLAPKDVIIKDQKFWDNVFVNLIKNYDRIYFDTGISYLEYEPIYKLYKIADKVILTSSTSIKSVASVKKQISKLKGLNKNEIFTKEDEMEKTLNLVITQALPDSPINQQVIETFENDINILGIFPSMIKKFEEAEYYGNWKVFDDSKLVNSILDRINE